MSDHEVLDAAFDVVAREGFDSFTFEQISKAVGLSPAALVKRFKNKRSLALLARNQRWDRNLARMNPDQIESLSGLEGIFGFLRIIALSVNSKRLGEHAKWLGTEAGHPSSKKKVAAYFEVTRSVFERLVRQAIKRGELKKIDDAKEFARTLEALVQGAIFQFAFLNERSVESHLKSHFECVFKPYR